MHCLLIEDDSDDQEFFKLGLDSLNLDIQLHINNNGIEAIQQLKNRKGPLPDLIFVDMNMPMMNGKDTVKQIRKLQGFSKIPVVMYSSYDKTYGVSEATKCGADLFFTKPTFIPDWANAIRSVFNKLVGVAN